MQHTELSFIQKNKLKLKFIIVLIIVKLKEDKNKKILYTNFRNYLFIYTKRIITLYRLQEMSNIEKIKRWRDRERDREIWSLFFLL